MLFFFCTALEPLIVELNIQPPFKRMKSEKKNQNGGFGIEIMGAGSKINVQGEVATKNFKIVPPNS